MLVISQKKGEKFHIGRDITVTVLEIRPGKVRIGIDAPDDMEIMRDSLLREQQEYDYDQENNQANLIKAKTLSNAPTARHEPLGTRLWLCLLYACNKHLRAYQSIQRISYHSKAPMSLRA